MSYDGRKSSPLRRHDAVLSLESERSKVFGQHIGDAIVPKTGRHTGIDCQQRS